MSQSRTARVGAWLLVVLVGLLAVSAWVYYAWRYSSSQTSTSHLGGGLKSEDTAAPRGEGMPTTLLAARSPAGATVTGESESAAADGAPEPRADDHGMAAKPDRIPDMVTANQPPSPHPGVEMDLGDKTVGSSAPAAKSLAVADQASARGDLVAARAALTAAVKQGAGIGDAAYARQEAARIADALLFSRATNHGDPLVSVHVVAEGDSLNAIARKYKITEELITSINRLSDPNRIMVGARLKVLHGPFRAFIDKTAHRMDIYLGDALVRSFRVGLGTNGGTPTGTWVVQDKLKNPGWTDPITARHYLADDPDNPIGERWIGLNGIEGECVGRVGFGIHGTVDPASIGENMSMGCVRLLPDDVAFLADLLVGNESRVVIR